MKLYLSIKDTSEIRRIKEVINSIENFKIEILNINNLKSLKKADIIICDDNDIEKIKSFYLLNKEIIVYKENHELTDNIYQAKKVYTYNSKNELSEIIHYIKNKNKKAIILPSIIFLFFIGILFTSSYTNILKEESKNKISNETKIIDETKIEKPKLDYDIKKENYVFLGDSITYFYNLSKFYPNLPVINSGIGGYQTQDIIDNLEKFVYRYNPTKVFLLIGTNDIELSDYSDEELVDRIEYIVKEIKKHRPKTKIYVESIYPVNRETDNDIVDIDMVKSRNNERIQKINKLIQKMCDKEDNTEYINMYDELIDENGNLKLEYTRDGLHTNDAGYEVITKKIMTYIESIENS